MNTEQKAEISRGTCMAKGQPLSAHHLDSVQSLPQPTYVFLGLPSSLSQEGYALSLRALQTLLYLWYSLTTLDTANMCTILAPHVMIK